MGRELLMPASEAQLRAINKYVRDNYDDIKVRVKKGERARIQQHASSCGQSMNAFILRAIEEKISRDVGQKKK